MALSDEAVSDNTRFEPSEGVFVASPRPVHRHDEYDEHALAVLLAMQRSHFWYRARHRLLFRVLQRERRRHLGAAGVLHAVDIGGGCGGWLEYLHARDPRGFSQLGLADSSMEALSLAAPLVTFGKRYHVDLLDLPWQEEWDVAFLLDVLEHVPDHLAALRQIRKSLRPGGLLFVTAPALDAFWSYNDELVGHQRRYRRRDFAVLADQAGLELLRAQYFMFALSPALFLRRKLFPPRHLDTAERRRRHLERSHRPPPLPVNALLEMTLSLEGSLVNWISFPWGTSVLAVFRRAAASA